MARGWWWWAFGAFVIGFVLAYAVFSWAEHAGPSSPSTPLTAAPGEACDDLFGRFVGLHDGRVAVFAGRPDGCSVLLWVQPHTIDGLLPFQRDDLQKGVVFHHDDELFQIIEGLVAP